MKTLTALITIFVWSTISLYAQTNDRIVTKVATLEKNGDKVDLSYTIRVNKDNFSDCESVFYDLFLKKGDQTIEFSPVIVHGKLRRNSYKRWLAFNGDQNEIEDHSLTLFADKSGVENLPYETNFPFEEWMDGAVLYGRSILWECGDHTSESTVELARLVIPAPAPVKVQEPVAKPEPEEKPEMVLMKEGFAFVDFPIGKSNVDFYYGSNQTELSKIGNMIQEILGIPKVTITGLDITGYASPDGSYSLNERLSRERAQALSRYINTFYKLELTPGQLHVHNVAEDWEGLAKLLENSDIPQRGEILRIIRGTLAPDEKEQQLMKLSDGSVYRILQERYFPKLRRTEYKIMYQIKEK